MSVRALLADLRARDVRVWVDEDRLRCNAPVGAITPELRATMRERKPEIVAFLRSADSLATRHRAIVPLQTEGANPPIFGVPGHNGDVFCYLSLAEHLASDQPIYGLQPPGLAAEAAPVRRIEELAAYFASQIREFHPTGPCVIAGFCAGGMTAYELARILMRERGGVTLALIGAPYVTRYRRLPILADRVRDHAHLWRERMATHRRALSALPWPARLAYVARRLRTRRPREAPDPVLVLRAAVERATLHAARRFTPAPLGGRAVLLLPNAAWARSREAPLRWQADAGQAEVLFGPDDCGRHNILREPFAGIFAGHLRQLARGTRWNKTLPRNPRGPRAHHDDFAGHFTAGFQSANSPEVLGFQIHMWLYQ